MIRDLPAKSCFDLRESNPAIVHVDVREPAAFARGRPRGARNVAASLPDFPERVRALSPDLTQLLIVSGADGHDSRPACEALLALGYTAIAHLDGGFEGRRDAAGELQTQGWSTFGLPVDTDQP